MVSRRAGVRARLCAGAALALLPLLAADVVFRVPEVLVRHAAASRPVGTGRANGSRANESEPWSAGDTLLEVRYEEYFVEHDVSTADARRAANTLNLDEVPATRPGCGSCSQRELEYCETRVLADHCCCERRFVREPFPWLPHSCYVGARRCRPLAHDCAQYARLRDCCCYRKLAERWKGILSKSTRVGVSGVSLLLLSMLLFVAYL
uniref:CCC domain-containing protein n=1 Tax=Heliothis virescens TaxID=7102 RepID=A0A2A4K4Q2_HELVI